MAVLSPFLEFLAVGAPAQVVPALNQPIPLFCMAGSSHSSLLGGLATLGSRTDPSPVVSFMARYSSTDPLPVSQAWAPLENPYALVPSTGLATWIAPQNIIKKMSWVHNNY